MGDRSNSPQSRAHSAGKGSSSSGSPRGSSHASSCVTGSDAAFSIQSRSSSRNSTDDANPRVRLNVQVVDSDEEGNTKPGDPCPATNRLHEQTQLSLNSLSVFSPPPLCDRAEYARRSGGGFHDFWGIYFPTPEERNTTLRGELAAVHGGANPLNSITGLGTLWVHQLLSDGLPQPLEGFRAELSFADDEPRLLRFQTVVQQTTKLCLHMLMRGATATELNVCIRRANELVKQTTRTPCTDRLKVALQQQAVKLHDLRVAVVSPNVILSALRCDDPNRLRTIFDSQRISHRNRKTGSSARQPKSAPAPSCQDHTGSQSSWTAPTVSQPAFASFGEFVLAALRDEAEYSLLTTLKLVTRPR